MTKLKELVKYIQPSNYLVKRTNYSDEYNTPVLTPNKSFLLGYTKEENTFNRDCIIIDDFTLDVKYVDFPFMLKSSASKILVSDQMDLYYLFCLLKTYPFVLNGHGRHYISYVQEIDFDIPALEEQQKIGSFFKELDELIELCADYKSLMIDKIKYTLSNAKPSTNKKCKVSELYSVTRGYYIPKDSLSMHGDYPVYSSQTKNKGIMGYCGDFLFENALIWATDGANAGEVRYVPGKFNCTNVCGVMINSEGYCNSYMAYYLNKLFKRYVSNSGIPKLMNNIVQNIPIELPTLEEQYELSNFIDEAVKVIDFIDELMSSLISKKKYYLNKIFK